VQHKFAQAGGPKGRKTKYASEIASAFHRGGNFTRFLDKESELGFYCEVLFWEEIIVSQIV